MSLGPSLRISRASHRLIVWCLLLALPLCGLSTRLVELLGSRHMHRAVVVADAGMEGWQDFRRGGHHGTGAAHAPVHSHGFFERHHHDRADDSVVALDGEAAGMTVSEGDSASAVSVSLVFASTSAADVLDAADGSLHWREGASAAFRSQDGSRLERPPRG